MTFFKIKYTVINALQLMQSSLFLETLLVSIYVFIRLAATLLSSLSKLLSLCTISLQNATLIALERDTHLALIQ